MRYNAEAPDVINPYSAGHLSPYNGLPSHEPAIPAYPLGQPAIPEVAAYMSALMPEAPAPIPSAYVAPQPDRLTDPASEKMHGELNVLLDTEAIVDAIDPNPLYVPDVLGKDRDDDDGSGRQRHLALASAGGSNGGADDGLRPRRISPANPDGDNNTATGNGPAGTGNGGNTGGRGGSGNGRHGGGGNDGGGGENHGPTPGEDGENEIENLLQQVTQAIDYVRTTGRLSVGTLARQLGVTPEQAGRVITMLRDGYTISATGNRDEYTLAEGQATALVSALQTRAAQARTPAPQPSPPPRLVSDDVGRPRPTPGRTVLPRPQGSSTGQTQPDSGTTPPAGSLSPARPALPATPDTPPRPEKTPSQVAAENLISSFSDRIPEDYRTATNYENTAAMILDRSNFWDEANSIMTAIAGRRPGIVMRGGVASIDGRPLSADDPDAAVMRELYNRWSELNERAADATRFYFEGDRPSAFTVVERVGYVADHAATTGHDVVYDSWLKVYGGNAELELQNLAAGVRLEIPLDSSNGYTVIDENHKIVDFVEPKDPVALARSLRNLVSPAKGLDGLTLEVEGMPVSIYLAYAAATREAGEGASHEQVLEYARGHYDVAGRQSPDTGPDVQPTPEPANKQYENDLVARLRRQDGVTVEEITSGYLLHMPGESVAHQISSGDSEELETWLARVNPDEAIKALLHDKATLNTYQSEDVLRALRRSKVHYYTDYANGPGSLEGATRVVVSGTFYALPINDEKMQRETRAYLQELKAQLNLLAQTDKRDFNPTQLGNSAVLRLPRVGAARRNRNVVAALQRIAAENPEDRDWVLEGFRDYWHGLRNIPDDQKPWTQLLLRHSAAPERVGKIKDVVFVGGALAVAGAALGAAGWGVAELASDDSPKHNEAKPSASASPFASQTPDSKPAAPAESATPKASKTPEVSPSKSAASKAPSKPKASPSKSAKASKTPGRTSSSPVAPSASAKPTGRTSSNPSNAPSKPVKSPSEAAPTAQDEDRNGNFSPSTKPEAKPSASAKPDAKPTTPSTKPTPKPSKPTQDAKQGDKSKTNKPGRPANMPPESGQRKKVVVTKDGPITVAYNRANHTATGTLNSGGTIWEMVEDSLRAGGDKTPDPAKVQRLTGDVLKQAGITWGEARSVDKGSTATIRFDDKGKPHVVAVDLK